jgi:hypothetical protein
VYAAALKGLAWFHRWVGVVLCLMFATWFATGAMMVFVAFPSLPAEAVAARSEAVDLVGVELPPAAAAARLGRPDDLRLVSRAGAPAYVGAQGSRQAAISAVDGQRLAALTGAQAGEIGSRFAGAPTARVSAPIDYDQWVVHQALNPWRPFYRVRLADRAATDLYVSAATGEVRQQTGRLQRAANWVGSVVHWIYFTPLRRSFPAWDWTVWGLALTGVTTAVAGIWLGVTRTSRKMRSQRPAVSPYRGLLRWHHVIGLAAGAFVLCWIVSGWLSMDHGRLFSDGAPSPSAEQIYRDGDGRRPAPDLTAADLRSLAGSLGPGATAIDFSQVNGCSVAAAQSPSGPRVLTLCPGARRVGKGVPDDLVLSAIRAAWPGERIVSAARVRADSPYAKAEGAPDAALQIQLAGPQALRLFVDPVSGRLLVAMDHSREAYAWVYYMLHTYNFPGLSERPVLRIVILLIPLTLGFIFSITGVLVGVRRLRALVPAAKAAPGPRESGR